MATTDLLTGRNLMLGGSVATAVLLTVFRREIAPAFKWLVTQANQLTDKTIIREGNLESLATLAAVGLTLFWSFTEFQASRERMQSMEGMEAEMGRRLEEVCGRLEAAEQRLGAAEGEVAALRRQVQELREVHERGVVGR
ncbi:hypothetical protein N2152v2_009822 [Parachlorella kessleri]